MKPDLEETWYRRAMADRAEIAKQADELARLRAEVDLLQTALQHGSDATASLRAENERLRAKLAKIAEASGEVFIRALANEATG